MLYKPKYPIKNLLNNIDLGGEDMKYQKLKTCSMYELIKAGAWEEVLRKLQKLSSTLKLFQDVTAKIKWDTFIEWAEENYYIGWLIESGFIERDLRFKVGDEVWLYINGEIVKGRIRAPLSNRYDYSVCIIPTEVIGHKRDDCDVGQYYVASTREELVEHLKEHGIEVEDEGDEIVAKVGDCFYIFNDWWILARIGRTRKRLICLSNGWMLTEYGVETEGSEEVTRKEFNKLLSKHNYDRVYSIDEILATKTTVDRIDWGNKDAF